MNNRKVIVIGAGIVGCSTAFALAENGWEVTLLDSHGGPGQGTSQSNGAQLSYSYVEPLATPGILAKLPSLLTAGDSPLTFRLRLDPHQWSWLARFVLACNAARVRETTRTLLALTRTSRQTLDRWLLANGWDCEFAMPGKLVLYGTPEDLAGARRQVEFQRGLGCRQELLAPAACAEIEPALAAYAPSVAGGVWTADECVIDPLQLTQQMAASLAAGGHAIHWNTPARSLIVRAGRVCGVSTPAGEMLADAVVVCSGIAANKLLSAVSQRLPIYPIKGYSVTLGVAPGTAAPHVSITDSRRKLVFARLGDRLRVAGRAEVVGYDLGIPQDRIDELLRGTREVFPDAGWSPDIQPWAGLRPCTPTGVPFYGPGRQPGLYLNTGHGALGLTLAAGSAQLLAERMTREAQPGAVHPALQPTVAA
ncbi:MAG: D-amino acid dehydrogenase [Burkholderiaceae bacterium]